MKKSQTRSKMREAGLETVEWVVMLVLIVIVAAGGFALLRGPIMDALNRTGDCIENGNCPTSMQAPSPETHNIGL